MRLLTELTRDALYELADAGSARIDNIIVGTSFYTMKQSSTVFSDMRFCLILLEEGYGFTYFQSDITWQPEKYVDRSLADVLAEDIPPFFRTALIDAVYSVRQGHGLKNTRFLTGSLREKARERAQIVLSTVEPGSKVLMLGAVTELIEEARHRSCTPTVMDLEDQKVGAIFSGVEVERATAATFAAAVMASDYVIATGMIFPCEWADEVFTQVKTKQKKLVLYMESGANFGQTLLRHGAHAVFAEFFPFYDFYGDTRCALHVQDELASRPIP